jgi:hypothetical protein
MSCAQSNNRHVEVQDVNRNVVPMCRVVGCEGVCVWLID